MPARYRLADPEHRVPMPDRGLNVFFTADPAGEGINPLNPFYARMIADRDLVPVEEEAADPAPAAQAEPVTAASVVEPEPVRPEAQAQPLNRPRRGE